MNHLWCICNSLIPMPNAPKKAPTSMAIPIFNSSLQNQYFASKIIHTAAVRMTNIMRNNIKFSQNCGLTCGTISHSSLDFSYSSMSFFTTSFKVSTRKSYFKSQSRWYTSGDTRIMGYFFCLPGIEYDYFVNNINTFVSQVISDNKVYIGGCYL